MAVRRVIGLDIGTTGVRAAQLEFGKGGPSATVQPTVSRLAQVTVAPGAIREGEVDDQHAVANALRELWQRGKFDTKEVVIGVGNPRTVVRDLVMPRMPLPQLRSTLPYQVTEMLPMQVSDALLDFYPTREFEGEDGPSVLGLLVAAPLDAVTTNIIAVEAAGLTPTMVDLNAFGLLRALARGDYLQRTVAFVDIGARTTTVVVSAAGVPALVRILRAGGQDATDGVATAMQVSQPDAERIKREVGIGFQPVAGYEAAVEAVRAASTSLVESVRNTLTFFASNNPGLGVEVVVLSGGGAHLPGLGQYLASMVRLPVTLADPFSTVRVGKGVNPSGLTEFTSMFTVCVGLGYGVAE